jgi:hypothetical protein
VGFWGEVCGGLERVALQLVHTTLVIRGGERALEAEGGGGVNVREFGWGTSNMGGPV